MAVQPARVGPGDRKGLRAGLAAGGGFSATMIVRTVAVHGWGAGVEMGVVCALAVTGALWLVLRDRRHVVEAPERHEPE